MKLKIIRGVQGRNGEQAIKEHPLKADRDNVIGRSTKDKTRVPDIDLQPDNSVSRRHACLVFKGDAWNISDLGSLHGTLVGDARLRETDPPIVVTPGEPIRLGNTILVMDPDGKHRVTWQNLSIAFDFPPSINYSLFHCGIPTLRNISILNLGNEPSEPFSLCFQVPGFSKECRVAVPCIQPLKSHSAKEVRFTLLQERLEELSERVKARIELHIDRQFDKMIIYDSLVWVLGFYEWSEEIEHRKTLAAFIQPGNPVVQTIISKAEHHLEELGGPSSFSDLLNQRHAAESAVKALYECLSRSYHITYVDPPISYELKSQVIRPPNRIITGFNGETASGSGTCVDLTLLMAACLECLYLAPLIVLVKENDWVQHSFAGCWRNSPCIQDTVLNYDQLNSALKNNEIILLECTGFARNTKLGFEEAVKEKILEIATEKFLYALNIVQLRQDPDRITPIENQASPEVLKIIRVSGDIARSDYDSKEKKDIASLNTAHLLYGCLTAGTEISRSVLISVPPRGTLRKISNKIHLDKSQGFMGVINAAKDLARRSGSACMEEHHLLWALLYCERKYLSAELKSHGLTAGELQRNLDVVLKERGIKVNPRDDSYCVKDDICAADNNAGVS